MKLSKQRIKGDKLKTRTTEKYYKVMQSYDKRSESLGLVLNI